MPSKNEYIKLSDRLLTAEEVREILGGIGDDQLRDLHATGKLEAVNHPTQAVHNSTRYYRESDVQNYIDNALVKRDRYFGRV